jgi:hypothetical protein
MGASGSWSPWAEFNEPFLGRRDHHHHLVEGEAPGISFGGTEDLDFQTPFLVVDLTPDNSITDEIGDEVFPGLVHSQRCT